jgi:hypothetical protein
VLPYLDGEVALALSGSIDTPDYTLLVHSSDVERIMRLTAAEANPRLNRDPRGVVHYDPQRGREVVLGYKSWVVYASTPTAGDQALDHIDGKGGPTLASQSRYQSVVARLTGDRLGFGYVDVVPIFERAAASSDDPRVADLFASGGRAAYAFGFDQSPDAGVWALGMRLEYAPDGPLPFSAASSADALAAMDRLPKSSMLAVAGPDIGLYGESLAALAEDDEVTSELRAFLAQFAGPYAVGVAAPLDTRGPASAASTFVGGIFFLATVAPDADPDEVSAAVTQLLSSADTGDAGAWQHEVVTADDWLAVNAVPPPTTLAQVPEDLLAADQTYQWARRSFVQNGTNSYVNLAAVEDAFLGQFAAGDELDAVRPLRAIGASSVTDASGDGHMHLQVLITKH